MENKTRVSKQKLNELNFPTEATDNYKINLPTVFNLMVSWTMAIV